MHENTQHASGPEGRGRAGGRKRRRGGREGGREGGRDLEVDLQGEDLVLDVAADAAFGVLPHALLEEVRLALCW